MSKEKVQIYAVQLHDVLVRLKIRFPDKFSPEEENWLLQDRFFFGMELHLQETIRHLFNQNIDFGDFLMAAWQNETEDLDAKVHSHIKAKSAVGAPRERQALLEN